MKPNQIITFFLILILVSACAQVEKKPQYTGLTSVSIQNGDWFINGQITYPEFMANGLLMNVRMVNSTFEDLNRTDFDPQPNTNNFIVRLPDYYQLGVRAITLNLQGGMPGYEGALNSAYDAKGNLRPAYMERIRSVMIACDQLGMAVILGCFYQRQDQILADEKAVKNAVVNTVEWIRDNGFNHVVLEIANEFMHNGFDHEIISDPNRHVELIQLAKQTNPNLLVSTSGMGNGTIPDVIAQASDFLLIHFNTTAIDDIESKILALQDYNKPIVCNEDDKTGLDAVEALLISAKNDCSYGYMNSAVNQYEPFEFKGFMDDPKFYDQLRRITVGS